MARPTLERKKIYKETVEAVLAKHDYSKGQFCRDMDHTSAWFSTTFTNGYYNITKPQLRLWAMTIGCTEDELTAIPVSPAGERKRKEAEAKTADVVTTAMIADLTATMIEGFRMLHQDMLNLIDTMDKYWKPEMPTIDRGQGDNRDD